MLLITAVLVICGLLTSQLVALASAEARDVTAVPVRRASGQVSVFLRDCQHRAVVEPLSVERICVRGSPYWANLQWSEWGRPTALARGSYLAPDCDCIASLAGPVRAYPVRIELGGLRVRSGVRQYTTMSVVFPSVRPRAITATGVHYRLGSRGFKQLDAYE